MFEDIAPSNGLCAFLTGMLKLISTDGSEVTPGAFPSADYYLTLYNFQIRSGARFTV